MEHRQYDGQSLCLTSCHRIVAHESAYHIDKGIEHAEHPDDAEHVEQQMSQCRPTRLYASTKCCEVGRCRSADILTHHQRNAEVDWQHTRGTEQDGDGHHCCRRLHDAGNQCTDKQEGENSEVVPSIKRGEEIHHRLVVSQIHLLASRTQHHQ